MKSLLFDLDGTIVASHTGIISSLEYTIDKLNLNCLKGRDLLCFVGPPLKQSFMEYAKLNLDETEEAIKVFRKHYAEKGLYNCELYAGMFSLLENLSYKADLYICTSKPDIFAKFLADYFCISNFFKAVIGSNLDGTLSKKSDIIKYIIDKYDIDKSEAVMIGDKYQDVNAANQWGIKSIGVLYGYGSFHELHKGNASHIVKTVVDLGNCIEDLL